MREVQGVDQADARGPSTSARVGAFEGAMYEAKGLYRPEVDCIMFTRNPTSFCAVCEHAVGRAIDRLVR